MGVKISLHHNLEDDSDKKYIGVEVSSNDNLEDDNDENHLRVKTSSNNLKNDSDERIALSHEEYYSCIEIKPQPLFHDNTQNSSTKIQRNNNFYDDFLSKHSKQYKHHCHRNLQLEISKQGKSEVDKIFVTPNPFGIIACYHRKSKRSRRKKLWPFRINICKKIIYNIKFLYIY